MTKHARKHRPAKKHHKLHRQPPVSKFKLKKPALALLITFILTAIPFSMGKYIEFNSPGAFDSGAYVYSARHILEGAEIGVEEKPSAQIGTLLINMLGVWLCGFNETGPKLIQAFLQAAALLLMFIAMRKLFGTLPAAIGVIIASIYLSAPLIAKFGNVKEQYMIAFMVMGISCFVLYQLSGKWWQAVIAGALLSWAPLFKQTGLSAIIAIGLFVVLQPLLKNKTFKQTGRNILLLLAGAAMGIGPLYVWIIAWNVKLSLPYSFVWQVLASMLPAGADATKSATAYVTGSRKLVSFSEQWPVVLRYYGLLILPIALAAGAIAARIVRTVRAACSKEKTQAKTYDRFVLLFALWWVLDMAFVWISPRSYEQYYLPLNASAAMLGGYLTAIYCDKFKSAAYKTRWVITGLVGFLLMIIMSWHIFFGIKTTPYTGRRYKNPDVRSGYLQKIRIAASYKKGARAPWEVVGKYIRNNSAPNDKIYVWGWFPGIYVAAQRFSSASKAVMMPRPTPDTLARMTAELLVEFEREMPKFIVDTRKRHIPTIRPPYELWPIAPQGFMGTKRPWFLSPDKNVIATYDKWWSEGLRKNFDEDEAERYKMMAPFRKFVMDNYEIAEPRYYIPIKDSRFILHRIFGQHVLLKLKKPTAAEKQE